MIFLAKRTRSINDGIRLGCKANPNIEAVWHNKITTHDIMDCVSCDSSSLTHNFIIKHDIADVSFSTANFRTITTTNLGQSDHVEVVHYKISKKCKSPIICTFDKELTDSPLPIVETENPAFNKEFTTFCEKDDDAFYILTPQVMEKMIEAAKTYKRVIYNFDDDDLFIIIYHYFFTSISIVPSTFRSDIMAGWVTGLLPSSPNWRKSDGFPFFRFFRRFLVQTPR